MNFLLDWKWIKPRAFPIPDSSDPAACLQLKEFGVKALALLQQYRWQIEALKTSEFLRKVEDWKQLLHGTEDPREMEKLRDKFSRETSKYLTAERNYLEEREVQLKDMVAMLSKALSSVSEQNNPYHERILENTRNLSQISQLEDIKKLRVALSSEVNAITATVIKKQSEDRRQMAELSGYVETLQGKLQKAVSQGLMDPLTELTNRQGWDQEIYAACRGAALSRKPFAVGVADVDNFKGINDNYGHQVGDSALKRVAQILRESFRADDVVARYGGDEFAFILRTPSLEGAQERLEKIGKKVAKETYHCVVNGKDAYLKLAITCGVSLHREGDTPETLLARADEALYVAKKSGKNKVFDESKAKPGNPI